jgi:hypothetical protein
MTTQHSWNASRGLITAIQKTTVFEPLNKFDQHSTVLQDQGATGGGNAWIKQLRVLRAFRLFRLFGKMGQV